MTAYVGGHTPPEADALRTQNVCTIKHVREVCSSSSATSIFDFLDALGNKDYKKVISLAEKELEENEPLGLQARVASHLRALLALMLKKDAAATALKLHPFQVKKLYSQIRNWDAEALKRGLRELLQFEYGVKSGNISEPKASFISTLSKIVVPLEISKLALSSKRGYNSNKGNT